MTGRRGSNREASATRSRRLRVYRTVHAHHAAQADRHSGVGGPEPAETLRGERPARGKGDLPRRAGEGVHLDRGPSGCGKTTLLKSICNLLEPSSGQVVLHGQRISAPPPEMVLVFQDYSRSLFPWLTVLGNVMFPLKKQNGLDKAEKEQRVNEAIEAVGLTNFAHSYPWQLSGGMQQRVAIARSVAFRPEILLLDEPFASVDALTREGLEDLVLRLRAKYGITVLLVTHDIDEAVYLSDRVFVLGKPPSVVISEVPVDLPRPREQTKTRSDPDFLKLRNEIHGLITHPPGKDEKASDLKLRVEEKGV
ncbi:ABC transporter ATP-binding protein [Rubrobacter marinus]|uniref:ABC transporter ATP-binding protein n=1 Tax=Rubrobacter marinus TaxID=2653852 RepID=UPI001A9FC7E4|nr:ABC transporter ATP-binding protein [Rubrobacter marinus]